MRPLSIPSRISLVLLLSSLAATASAANFTCNTAATCGALLGYVAPNATTLAGIRSLFQVSSLESLLGANSLPLSTPSSRPVPAGSTVRVPFPCRCANRTGQSDRTPVYTVQAGDGLDAIARNIFDGVVTYQEIAAANGLADANNIQVGQRLWVPLPCSCDPVAGEAATVHLAHIVANGSSVAAIAAEFGTTESTLMALNGITDPKTLQAGQPLDVPLRACSSSISDGALDYNLRLPNDSYALTADGCILCSCSASSYQLDCHSVHGQGSSVCPTPTCDGGRLLIGNASTSGCEVTTCAYGGYTNATGLTIITIPTWNWTACSNGGSAGLGLQGKWAAPLIFVHMALVWLCFLGQ